MNTHHDILLDDYGMLLFGRFQEACESYQCSIAHLSFEAGRKIPLSQGATELNDLKRKDIWPRHRAFVDHALLFMEHYYLLEKHPDIALRHDMSSHLLIDTWADLHIDRIRLALATGTTTRDEWSILHQLLDTLQRCERIEAVRS